VKITREEVLAIIEHAGTQMDTDQLTDDVRFADIGADSLDIMEMLLGVQEKTGQEVPDEDVEKLGTVNEILAYVNDN